MIEPIIPDPQELIARIKRHMEDRPGDERMVLLWLGFIAGLGEFGLLDTNVASKIRTEKGRIVGIPIGDSIRNVKVAECVQVSLDTRDPR
jgi:hypothetical protein